MLVTWFGLWRLVHLWQKCVIISSCDWTRKPCFTLCEMLTTCQHKILKNSLRIWLLLWSIFRKHPIERQHEVMLVLGNWGETSMIQWNIDDDVNDIYSHTKTLIPKIPISVLKNMDGLFNLSTTTIKIHLHGTQILWNQWITVYVKVWTAEYLLSQHIHSLLLQFGKDTHSMLLIDPVIYLVRWVSNLKSQNSDESYLFLKNLLNLLQSPSSTGLCRTLLLE